MKYTLITIALMVTASSYAGFFGYDTIEDQIKKNGGVIFNYPKIGGNRILANSSCEVLYLTEQKQHEIQVKRLINFCKSIGYQTPVLGAIQVWSNVYEYIDYEYDQNGTGAQDYGCSKKSSDGSLEHRTYALHFNRIGCLNRIN